MSRVTKPGDAGRSPGHEHVATAAAPAWTAATTPAGQTHEAAEASAANERELIRKAQGGDVAAYEDLVRRHQARVFAVIGGILRRSEEVEDLAQQVFLKVYVSLGRFDLRSAFSTWLYKVAVNECLDYLRKKKVRKLVYESDMSEEQAQLLESGVAAESRPGEISAERQAELRQLLDRLLAELPEQERLMMVLKEVEGWTVEEIGQMLELNVNTVKVRLFRARLRLEKVYRRRMDQARRVARELAPKKEGRRPR